MKDDTKEFEVLPHNGQDGEPCPFGCIFIKKNGTTILHGDCRAPSRQECYFNASAFSSDEEVSTSTLEETNEPIEVELSDEDQHLLVRSFVRRRLRKESQEVFEDYLPDRELAEALLYAIINDTVIDAIQEVLRQEEDI